MRAGSAAAIAFIAVSLMAARPETVPDRFIQGIETIKRSVAPVACVAVSGTETKLLTREGTAFFVSREGEFLTAGHVIEQMNQPRCPVWGIILPVLGWQPDLVDESLSWFRFEMKNCSIEQSIDVAVCLPLGACDPMTFRANVSAFRPAWRDGQSVSELVLDRAAWPGSSGSPVFLEDGRVIGVLIAGRMEDGLALATVRPVSAVRDFLSRARLAP